MSETFKFSMIQNIYLAIYSFSRLFMWISFSLLPPEDIFIYSRTERSYEYFFLRFSFSWRYPELARINCTIRARLSELFFVFLHSQNASRMKNREIMFVNIRWFKIQANRIKSKIFHNFHKFFSSSFAAGWDMYWYIYFPYETCMNLWLFFVNEWEEKKLISYVGVVILFVYERNWRGSKVPNEKIFVYLWVQLIVFLSLQ